jgi:predicted transcriptional regulator
MEKLPCEKAIWDTIPVIRKEMACCMVNDFGLKQNEAATILNITPSAVSQYKCNKRADKTIDDVNIINEIKFSSKKIIENGNSVLESEICRLCRIINKNDPCPLIL